MSERTDAEYVNDILEAIRRIAQYIDTISYEAFLGDLKTQDAVIRNLEIIGEATKNLSTPFRAHAPEIPWKNMAGLRDRLIHGYFGVNLDIVWQVAIIELPKVGMLLEARKPQ